VAELLSGSETSSKWLSPPSARSENSRTVEHWSPPYPSGYSVRNSYVALHIERESGELGQDDRMTG
jgi:hypothetical protein